MKSRKNDVIEKTLNETDGMDPNLLNNQPQNPATFT